MNDWTHILVVDYLEEEQQQHKYDQDNNLSKYYVSYHDDDVDDDGDGDGDDVGDVVDYVDDVYLINYEETW